MTETQTFTTADGVELEAFPVDIRTSNGVKTFGLYVDFAVVNATTNTLMTQERRFLAGKQLSTYSRAPGAKRAAWKSTDYETREEAEQALLMAFDFGPNRRVVLTAPPVSVELAAADLTNMENGDAPNIRHAGVVHTEKLVGKFNDDADFSEGDMMTEALAAYTAGMVADTDKETS